MSVVGEITPGGPEGSGQSGQKAHFDPIVLNGHGETLIPDRVSRARNTVGYSNLFPTSNEDALPAPRGGTAGTHQHCGGRLTLVRISEKFNALVCDGGCNLRFPLCSSVTTFAQLRSQTEFNRCEGVENTMVSG